jgi:hypothetical protein
VAEKTSVLGSNPADVINIFWISDIGLDSVVDIGTLPISEWTQLSISEPFRYRNDSFQSDIFSSDIRITDVDDGCRISPILRSMSMPTYAEGSSKHEDIVDGDK